MLFYSTARPLMVVVRGRRACCKVQGSVRRESYYKNVQCNRTSHLLLSEYAEPFPRPLRKTQTGTSLTSWSEKSHHTRIQWHRYPGSVDRHRNVFILRHSKRKPELVLRSTRQLALGVPDVLMVDHLPKVAKPPQDERSRLKVTECYVYLHEGTTDITHCRSVVLRRRDGLMLI